MVEVFAANQGDCNSNNLEVLDATLSSYRSNGSSQDNADFFQDYSDYQWFADYRYRDSDNFNHHTSILSSISENYNIPCYEDVSRDLDVNLAQVDMENLKTEDIHNILSTLPSMCGQDLQIVSTESFCKNKQLFSPVKEQSPNPFITFSTDSLDCSDDMLITCKANNKHNYTIAFEEPTMGVSEEFQNSEAMSTGESRNTGSGEVWSSNGSVPAVSAPMISSDTTFTTWNKLKKCTTSATTNCTQQHKEHASLSSSVNEKTQSLPDLMPLRLLWLKQKKSHYNYLVKSTQSEGGNEGRVKLYDVSGTKNQTDSAKFSLVKMFISQKKNRQSDGSLVISDNEAIEVTEPSKNDLEDSLMCENEKPENTKRVSNNNGSNNSSIIPSKHLWKGSSLNKSMQTSSLDGISNTKSDTKCKNSPVYVMFPSYTLPDLSFLQNPKAALDINNVFLVPQKFSPLPSPEVECKKFNTTPIHEPSSEENSFDLKSICAKGFDHVSDWDSLALLLPRNVSVALSKTPELKDRFKQINFDIKEPSFCHTVSKATEKKDNMFIYQYDDLSQHQKPPVGRVNSKIPIKNELKRPINEVPKRFSMFDMKSESFQELQNKRRSLPSQLTIIPNIAPIAGSDVGTSEDEGVECSGSNCDSPNPCLDEAKRLDSLLRQNKQSRVNLKSHVNKYLNRASGHHTPPNSPNQTTIQSKKEADNIDRFEGCEINKLTDSISHKKDLVRNCCFGAEKIAFCLDNDYTEDLHSVVLDVFCPALYALFSENLKSVLETSFGSVNNSVWQVIEASSQQGVLSSALNELTAKINNELALNEGVMKFNAFIFGLLNVGGLDAWLSYMRTRESIWQKYYNRNALFVRANFGCTLHRDLVDRLITSTKPLANYKPEFDPLYECRKLHESLSNINNRTSWLLKKTARTLENEASRPRSYVDSAKTVDVASTASKRWSGVHMGSKLATAFGRLDNIDERIQPELEINSEKETPVKGNRFRRLQMKWELLSTKDLTVDTPNFDGPQSVAMRARRSASKSRIPRPVLSPIQPVQDNFGKRPMTATYRADSPTSPSCANQIEPTSNKIKKPLSASKATRPSSLPQRRLKEPTRYVRTLSHRLSADNGHLSFNEGEKLQLVLEVDDKWILCCRGARKGLVPRSSVLIVSK
ncbi:uncharacterized protein LOC112685991 isoform X4 [Sipha flava]|nr:uncharacterized protein LOC112685991 isoform X4 [Sipha flava]